jgi:bacteriorhodopsin
MEHIYFSFYIAYVLLLTTGTITFIEALRNNNPKIRHVMNLETCISLVGAYFYSLFKEKIKKPDWKEITLLRYIDWGITTPFMLLSLCLVLSMNAKTTIHIASFLVILVLNYLMLLFGYLGETNRLDRYVSDGLGFIAFFATYGLIFKNYVLPNYSLDNYVLFSLYVVVWSIYGVAYLLSEIQKNILMNYLDVTAKCLIGIGLWAYYTKILRV